MVIDLNNYNWQPHLHLRVKPCPQLPPIGSCVSNTQACKVSAARSTYSPIGCISNGKEEKLDFL